MPSRRWRGWAVLVTAVLVVGGCGDDDPSGLTIVNRTEDDIVVVLAGDEEEVLGRAGPGGEVEVPARSDDEACLAGPLVARTAAGAEVGRLGPGLCLDDAVAWNVTPAEEG
jgi:hypothetical protein